MCYQIIADADSSAASAAWVQAWGTILAVVVGGVAALGAIGAYQKQGAQLEEQAKINAVQNGVLKRQADDLDAAKRDRLEAQARLIYAIRTPALPRGEYVDAGAVPVYAI